MTFTSGRQPDPDPPALLAVAHGSSEPAAEEITRAIVEGAGALLPGVSAHAAFLEHAGPRPAEVLALLAARSVRRVVVLPLLLSQAGHARDDIATLSLPGLELMHGRALGPHPLLDEVVRDRLAAAAPGGVPVLLAAAGTRDDTANAAVRSSASSLVEAGSASRAVAGFASLTTPTPPEAAAALRRAPEEEIAFAPYFLSWGRLSRAAARATTPRWVAEPIGADPRVSIVLAERYREALDRERQPLVHLADTA